MAEITGTVLNDKYRILAEVGRSCLGKLYAAEVVSGQEFGQVTALVVHDGLIRGKRFSEFLRGEVQKLSQVDSASLAQVLAVSSIGDSVIVVFDCAPLLPTLQDVLAKHGTLPLDRAVRIGRALALALAAAERAQLYHGFLRPEVVLVRENDGVYLREYGLFQAVDLSALITQPWFYSSPYLALERSCREPADSRADPYVFGVILAEMLTGTIPQHSTPLPPFPGAFDPIVRSCLNAYQTCPMTGDDIVALLDGMDVPEPGAVLPTGEPHEQAVLPTWVGACDADDPGIVSDSAEALVPARIASDEDARAECCPDVDVPEQACVGEVSSDALIATLQTAGGPVLVGDTEVATGERSGNLVIEYVDVDEGELRPSGRGGPVTLPFGGLPDDLAAITPDNAAGIRRLQRLGRGRASQVVYSPDGRFLALATSLGVELWACESWHMKYIMRDHPCQVAAVAFSPDGRHMASAGWDNSLTLWDMASGEPTRRLNGHDGSVLAVQFHPNGRILASAGEDERISLWDVDSGTRVGMLEGHSSFVRRLAFSRDGRILASASTDGSVRLWDLNCMRAGPVLRTVQGGAVWALAYSPAQHLVASGGSEKDVVLWDTLQGRRVGTLSGHCGLVAAVAFDPPGTLLASAGADGAILLWDVRRGRRIGRLEGHAGGITDLAISPDGKTLASTGRDRRVRLWNLKTGHLAHYLEGYTPQMTCLAFSGDGKTIAAGNDEASVQLWSLTQPMEVMSVRGHSGLVHSVAFGADGRILLSAGRDQTVRLWDPLNGGQLRVMQAHEGPVYVAAMSPNGETVASGGMDGLVILWNAKEGTSARSIRAHVGGVLSLAFHPNGETLVSGGADETIRFWHIESGRPLQQFWSCRGVIRGLAYSTTGAVLASAGGDGNIRLWDAEHFEERGILRGHTADVNSVAFSPDARLLASGSDDATVRLWDIESQRELVRLTAHTAWVNAVSFSPDGTLLASGSMDGTIRLWGVSD